MMLRSAILIGAALVALAPSAVAQSSGEQLPERWRVLQQLPDEGSPEIWALLEDIQTGAVDPLALLRQISPRVAVPPGFTYQQACSRALGYGAAVFTLGNDVPTASAELLSQYAGVARSAGPTDQARLGQLTLRYAASVTAAPGVKEAADFYRKLGFTPLTVATSYPFEWSADPERRRLHVGISGINPTRFGPYPECQALPGGTTILLSIR